MKLYLHYIKIHVLGLIQYKASFLMLTIGQFLVTFNLFLGVYFLFQRFYTIEGFRYEEVLLCFAIVLMQFSLAEIIGRGFDSFPTIINKGEFDRMLVRPQPLMLQVLGAKFELSRLGRVAQAIVMFVYAISYFSSSWSWMQFLTLISMLIGGTLLFMGLFILYASFCFFTLQGLEIMNIFTDGAREFGTYPLAVYGKRVLQFLTYILPYSLIQYYPFLYLTGRSNQPALALLPLVAVLFLIPCILCWRFGVSRYTSSGS